MRYLIDTHTFLWLATDDPQLSPRARALFEDVAHECFLSVASIWEMSIKASIGKLVLALPLPQLVRGGVLRGMQLLDVMASHAYGVERLPFHHRDPFDRLIVSQAIHEGMPVVSCDAVLDAYGVTRVWA